MDKKHSNLDLNNYKADLIDYKQYLNQFMP